MKQQIKPVFFKENQRMFLDLYLNFFKNQKLSAIYHPNMINYYKLIAKPFSDESFVLLDNNKCVGICYCPIYQNHQGNSISNNNGFIPAPITLNEKLQKLAFNLIDQIAIKNSCCYIKYYLDTQQHIQFDDDLEGGGFTMSCSDSLMLKKYNYIDSSSIDLVIPLKISQEKLWQNLRRRYKSLLNSYLKNQDFKVEIYNAWNPSKEIHDLYVHYHHLCSRRKTRTDESFEIQYNFLVEDFSSLFILRYRNSIIGCCYFIHANSSVFYHSGSDDPQYEGSRIPIYHLILYHACLHFSQLGYKTMSLSQPSNFFEVQGFNDYSDQKQLNIALFKRGMGGQATPLIRGIKYFDQKCFQQDVQEFMIQGEKHARHLS